MPAILYPYRLGLVAPAFRHLAKKDEYICSELVARAYKEAGVDLWPDEQAHELHPNALIDSNGLMDVTDELLVRRTREDMRGLHGLREPEALAVDMARGLPDQLKLFSPIYDVGLGLVIAVALYRRLVLGE
jgi:hypothetical protein